jgi:nucleotide-binding universal stress UspA family protein
MKLIMKQNNKRHEHPLDRCLLLEKKKTAMKNILVPIDFSKQSMEALKVAIELAGKTKAKITVVHVGYVPVIYDTGLVGQPVTLNPTFIEQIQLDAKKKLDRIKSNSNSDVRINTEVLVGDITTSIKDSIEEYSADLVVIGSSGVSGMTALLVGSVTEKIVRNSPVPVLTIWKSFSRRKIKDILLPSTLDLDQTDFVRELKKLQEMFNATIHILYVNTPFNFMTDQEVQESFNEYIKHYKLTNCKTHLRNYRTEEEGIINFAYSQRMDVIAMATHARKGLSHLFMGSVTEEVVDKVTIPIWTYCIKKHR